MSFRYLPFKETLFLPDVGEYESFGIRIYRENKIILSISDISTDRNFVHRLAEEFTEHQLSPVHIYDILEDNL